MRDFGSAVIERSYAINTQGGTADDSRYGSVTASCSKRRKFDQGVAQLPYPG
jgi:hypothetical protein